MRGLVVGLLGCLAFGLSAEAHEAPRDPRLMIFPATASGGLILPSDLHTHSVFSDGMRPISGSVERSTPVVMSPRSVHVRPASRERKRCCMPTYSVLVSWGDSTTGESQLAGCIALPSVSVAPGLPHVFQLRRPEM